MTCRFDRGFLSVQVTIRRQHDAETAKIVALVNALALGEKEKLVIVYAVPRSRLAEFETAPVNPLLGRTAPSCLLVSSLGVVAVIAMDTDKWPVDNSW